MVAVSGAVDNARAEIAEIAIGVVKAFGHCEDASRIARYPHTGFGAPASSKESERASLPDHVASALRFNAVNGSRTLCQSVVRLERCCPRIVERSDSIRMNDRAALRFPARLELNGTRVNGNSIRTKDGRDPHESLYVSLPRRVERASIRERCRAAPAFAPNPPPPIRDTLA